MQRFWDWNRKKSETWSHHHYIPRCVGFVSKCLKEVFFPLIQGSTSIDQNIQILRSFHSELHIYILQKLVFHSHHQLALRCTNYFQFQGVKMPTNQEDLDNNMLKYWEKHPLQVLLQKYHSKNRIAPLQWMLQILKR